MRSQNQYTIYSLNDVVTQETAPSNPYKGQLWVDTSKSPPVTKTYNGSSWLEVNRTDTLRSNITTLNTKYSTLSSDLSGLTSTVGETTERVETLESDLGVVESNVSELQSDVSILQQTATEISAEVSNKVDSTYGSSSSSFGWKLLSSGFYIYSNATTVMKITSSGLEVSGKITSSSGTIGGFTIDANSLKNGTWGSSGSVLVCTGSSSTKSIGGSATISGWCFVAGSKFGVTTSGDLYASNASITGYVCATSGYFDNCEFYEGCTIYGWMYLSGAEEVKFYGSKVTMYYETWIGGTGWGTEITQTSGGVGYISYSYIRPFGMTIVPVSYSAFANDGMIFGIMQTYSFKTQNLLTGVSYFYSNNGTNIYAEAFHRSGDCTYIDAVVDTSTGYHYIYWGQAVFYSYMSGQWMINDSLYVYGGNSYIATYYYSSTYYGCFYGRWYFNGSVYFGTSLYGYITTTTQSSTVYPYLAGSWWANTLRIGSYTSYNIRIDGDQITWYYNGTQVGEIESYTTYTDIQGTFKTNGSSWISSSDVKVKDFIEDYDDRYSAVFDNLRPRRYKYKKGTSGRYHTGFIVQEVLSALEVAELPTSEFAAVCAFGDFDNEETQWGLRYEEIIPMNTWEIQKLKARVKELEEKIKLMEEHSNETNSTT